MIGQELVGRADEVDRAAEAVRRLGEGHGGLLLLTGDPGIGKTRLAEEVVARAEARGVRTAWATAWQHAGAPPLWPWSQVLRRLGVDATAALPPAPVSDADRADAARFAQFDAVDRALDDLAAEDPLLVVLDDLQWADVATLRLLTYLLGSGRARRLLVVGTCRPDEIDPEELAALTRAATTLALTGLDAEAVRDVLAATLGAATATEVADVVAARSGGNPLFVAEFGRLLRATGRAEVAAHAVPAGVVPVIERRLARLPEQVMAVVRAAAVLGRRFPLDLLVALVTGVERPAVVAALDDAVRSGVLAVDGDGFGFAHDLVLDVVRESTAREESATLHARAAAALQERVGTNRALHSEIATHLQLAGDNDGAGAHWRGAADWALSMSAWEEAAESCARARACTDPGSRTAVDLLLTEGDALLRAGALVEARATFASAVELARSLGEPEAMVRGVLGIGAGAAGWEVPISDSTYVRLIEDALAVLPAGERRLRAQLLARLSVARATPETLSESERLAEEALGLARDMGDPRVQAQAIGALCDAIAGPAHSERRQELAEALVALAIGCGDQALELLGRRLLVVALLEQGDFAALDREIVAFERTAEVLRQPLLTWYGALFRGTRALMRGHVAEALEHCERVHEAAGRTGSVNAGLLAVTQRTGIDVLTGRPALLDLSDLVDVDPASWASYAATTGYVALLAGDLEQARSALHAHAENGFERIGDDSEHLTTVMMFGRTAVGLGEHGAVAAMYDALSPYSARWIVDGIAAQCWGPVALELGRLARALGRADAARAHLTTAHALIQNAGAVVYLPDLEELEASLAADPAVPAPVVAATHAGPPASWCLDGGLRTIAYAGRTIRVPDSKGLVDLAALLARPGRETAVVDLAGAALGSPREGDLGAVLDDRARRAYRARLRALEEEIDEASHDGDRGRRERAEDERDFLVAELTAAVGLGGRSRAAGDPVERARKAVSARIRLAIERIGRVHPELAAHLRNSVRTGTYCSYRPEVPITWVVGTRSGDASSDVAPPG